MKFIILVHVILNYFLRVCPAGLKILINKSSEIKIFDVEV